mmetsp:Transcript_138498/g.442673  ORF Transcript_138498/g.442673 Transcript_138498/m.442673 type:complete len:111 (+) Transcript_138498:1694-2026(+)
MALFIHCLGGSSTGSAATTTHVLLGKSPLVARGRRANCTGAFACEFCFPGGFFLVWLWCVRCTLVPATSAQLIVHHGSLISMYRHQCAKSIVALRVRMHEVCWTGFGPGG